MWHILTLQIVPVSITGVMCFGPLRQPPETPDSWSPRTALIGLGPTSVSGRVVEEMASETTFSNQTKTRQNHSLNHRSMVFFSVANNHFAFPKSAGFAKIKVSTLFEFGRPCVNPQFENGFFQFSFYSAIPTRTSGTSPRQNLFKPQEPGFVLVFLYH